MEKKSGVYNFEGKTFRYNYDYACVEWISKANEEMIKEEEEWKSSHNGRGLFDIDEKGFCIVDCIGLNSCNWENKETRNEYLSEWINEINYKCSLMAREFI